MPLIKRFALIKQHYDQITPSLLKGERHDPYFIDWMPIFTPIEYDAWASIRYRGLPLYPQFPVGRFFVDFGDPRKKVALECDGAAFHDAEKDAARDAELMGLGWVVYRVTGRECVRPALELSEVLDDVQEGRIDSDEFHRKVSGWALETSDGVIAAIALKHYGARFPEIVTNCLHESLLRHCRQGSRPGDIDYG